MRILLKNLLPAYDRAPKPVHLLLDMEKGQLVSVAKAGEGSEFADKIHDFQGNAYAAPGWIDLFATCGEPSDERAQTLAELAAEAAEGGYGHILLHPHHAGQFDSEMEIEAVSARKAQVQFSVSAPLSDGLKGKKLRDLLHFAQAGALAFSDGHRYEGEIAFYNQALQYGRNLAQPIFIRPDIASISQAGQVNEGDVSAITGLPAVLPNLEEMAVRQYLQVCSETGSRLHFSCLTDPEAVKAVLEAQSYSLPITFDVSAAHLVHDEREYEQFNSAHKVYPFLRTEEKVQELRELVKAHRPAIASNHLPNTPEAKDTDFTHAEFGARTLTTAPWAVIAACGLTAWEAYECFHAAPARVLGLEPITLKPGSPLNLNVFSLDTLTRLILTNNSAKSPLSARFYQTEMTSQLPQLFQF